MERARAKLVVVGGGLAGSLLAKTMQTTADVTLIDPKDYFEITWGRLRGMVEPSFGEKTAIYHKDYLTNGHVITSRAVSITDTHVGTEDGRQVPYDYLAIATGVVDNLPRSRSERLNQFIKDNDNIKSARSILVVGGGPAGVELAGEIAVDYPDKKVTLVHSGPRLLEFIGSKASRKALQWLKRKGVEVKLNQKVDLSELSDNGLSKTYNTTSGETIRADRVFVCLGKPLATSWLKETYLKHYLDSRERVMVDEHLRVKGKLNVFALGDITDIPELKQGCAAKQHALVAAKNLNVMMGYGKGKKMESYKAAKAMAIVSLGRKSGVAQLPFMTMSGSIPGMMKSRHLFVGQSRADLGIEP